MKKIIGLTFFISFLSVLLANPLAKQLEKSLDNQNISFDMKKEQKIAFNCLKPLKPLLPLKPLWCNGTWTQMLECDQYCNCMWKPVCLE